MLSNILASCVGYTICAVSASLHVASNQIIQFSQLPNAIETPSSTNISTSTNLQGKFSVECNGADYGNDLLVADCIDAIAYLPFNSRQWTFADRATPQATADTVLLPYRSMGDEGKCYVGIMLAHGANIAHASLAQIKTAAEEIMRKCTVGGHLQGGTAYNIGGDDKLDVVVGAYSNPVQCRGQFPSWMSCRDLLEDVPATKLQETFGVDVPLPFIMRSRDHRCQFRVFSVTGPDTSSGYEIWQALTAIYSVCLRDTKTGSIKGLGKHGKLLVNVAPVVGSTDGGSPLAIA